METIDEETLAAAKEFITRQTKAGKPFLCWWNGTRMHFRTHFKAENRHQGHDGCTDGMIEHDLHVGELLKLLDDLGIANNTIVQYSTDNGPHYNTWPDAGTTPFRSEKNSNGEGAYRVPCFVRWSGHFPAGEVRNGIVSHEDWLPTFAATPDRRTKQYFELATNRALYDRGWVACSRYGLPWETLGRGDGFLTAPWELYNIEADFSQAHDLAPW